jgi:hypothetical protein
VFGHGVFSFFRLAENATRLSRALVSGPTSRDVGPGVELLDVRVLVQIFPVVLADVRPLVQADAVAGLEVVRFVVRQSVVAFVDQFPSSSA